MNSLLKANERGFADHGWLQSQHSFSFAAYYNPEQQGFSDLLVINDDRIAPSQGFRRHPHRDMEIFSYVLEGSLQHQDSLGNGTVMQAGDIQLMSAGTGVIHSEFNASDQVPVHFLQIWIGPAVVGLTPSYQQKHFSSAGKRGRLQLLMSPDGLQDSLQIHQDSRIYAGLFNSSEQACLSFSQPRNVYIHLACGSLSVNGQRLEASDGLRIREPQQIEFRHGDHAHVLVFDLRPHELPDRN